MSQRLKVSALNKAHRLSLKRFCDRIHRRTTQPQPLSWLLDRYDHEYLGDYLRLTQMGDSSLQSFLNQSFSKWLPFLWYRLVLDNYRRQVSLLLSNQSLPLVFQTAKQDTSLQTPIEQDKVKSYFTTSLDALFHKGRQHFRSATMTELMWLMSQLIQDLCDWLGIDRDLYKTEKARQLEMCLPIYSQLRQELPNTSQAFAKALLLATRANWIDSYESNVDAFIAGFRDEAFAILEDDDILQFQSEHNPYFRLTPALALFKQDKASWLIDLDNQGEVLFDLIWIERCLAKGHHVTLSLKEHPMRNDITMSDLTALLQRPELAAFRPYIARQQLHLIQHASTIPGKFVAESDETYQTAYRQADLVVFKGQGHFQTMPMGQRRRNRFIPYPYHKPHLYLMGVKSPLMVQCFRQLFSPGAFPKLQTPFIYHFDATQSDTYPM